MEDGGYTAASSALTLSSPWSKHISRPSFSAFRHLPDRRQTVLHALFILKLWPYNIADLHPLIELARAWSDRKLQPSENGPMPTDQDLLRSFCFRPSIIKSCPGRHNEHHLETHHAEFTQMNLVPDQAAHLSWVSILLRWVCASLLSVW